MRSVGKQIGDHLYLHISAIDKVHDVDERAVILSALRLLPDHARAAVNVVKLHRRSRRVTMMEYAGFDDDPFPALLNSWTALEGEDATRWRSYADSLNPPVLHRKELLVDDAYPGRSGWAQLTGQAESIGLFDDVKAIGFQWQWRRLMASKGYQLQAGQLVPLGNETGEELATDGVGLGAPVPRHLTALTRQAYSAPVQLLLRHGLLSQESRFFDYGCGRGDDVAALVAAGFQADGWDPHYAPGQLRSSAAVVNLGFVLNVIEDPSERAEVLQQAFALTTGVLSVAVMLHGADRVGRPFEDGVISSRGTFQKYFSQQELKEYIERVVRREVFAVGPGVVFVFHDDEWEQRFVVNRYRRRDVVARSLGHRAARASRSQPAATSVESASAQALLQTLWQKTLDLGRWPDPSEVPFLTDLASAFGSLGRALCKMNARFDAQTLARARSARADDLTLYFAHQVFCKRARYRQLERRLQLDIKAFFGDYGAAQQAGKQLLEQAAKPEVLLAECQQAAVQGFGWFDGDHLQCHISLVERLPVTLRAFVSCGLLVWGESGDIDLVKIHAGSAKLTLMQYDNFVSDPMPRLSRRVKVNVRLADYDVFDYGTSFPKPALYRKSRYMHEEAPGFAEQQSFDEALEATGVLPEAGFGPTPDALGLALALQRLQIVEGRLSRSMQVPDLDERCGKAFTFRQLIECGETQARLRLPNVPIRPESYNALYDLATLLLDPIVEYFGAIRLTYGFCSPSLSKHIKGGIAPSLDQHTACEFNRRGVLICARGGAACDFIIDDEDMYEVADWIYANLPFDRMYVYGSDRPLHLSCAPTPNREAYHMRRGPSGRLLPQKFGPRAA